MSKDLEAILAECLDGLRSGELSVKECLERHPKHREELRSLLAVADRLAASSNIEPSPAFRRAARARLIARLVPPAPAPVTFSDRLRALWTRLEGQTPYRRPRLAWAAMVALVLVLMGGGGVGLAFAADGSSPGSPLYGVDRAVESLRLALARSPEGRAELAMAFAQERLAELENLIDSEGSDEEIQQAIDGYGEHISQAAQALAEVTATGEEARTVALAALLDQALSVHIQVLAEVQDRVPEKAQAGVGRAIEASQNGRRRVQEISSQGRRGGPPDDSRGGGPPDTVPGGSVGSSGDEDSGKTHGFEDRVAGLEHLIAQAQDHLDDGDDKAAKADLLEYAKEVDALAKDLAAGARDDAARAVAMAALLEETLSIQAEILTQMSDGVPDKAADAIERAMASTEAALATIRELSANGFPSGAPYGVTPGPPGGSP